MRRVGKIGRRKVFSEVKNVNVKSLKNGSKLLDFWSSTQEWRSGGKERGRDEETKRGRDGGSDESRHLLLPFPVLRSLLSLRSSRSLRSLQTLRTIRTIRSIRVLNSIRETRVQKQNVRFVFRFVYSFERLSVGFGRSLCRVLDARCVEFNV